MRRDDHSKIGELLTRREVTALPAYDPGADPEQIRTKYGVFRISKLSNNENPLGISPAVAETIARRIADSGRYPDPASVGLRETLALRFGISQDRIIVGNGSENILELLAQAFLNQGDKVVTQAPCFGLHEIFPMMMGATVQKVGGTKPFEFNKAAWRAALMAPTKMTLISNPSNPVGSALTWEEFQFLMKSASNDTLLVLDEAYFEYAAGAASYPDAFEQLRSQSRPWIVLRTFSKAYGLAGLRVGYGLASHAHLIDALNRVRTPYNVNYLAQQAAIAALSDKAHLEESVRFAERERGFMTTRLKEIGLSVAPSLTNFLFVDTGRNALAVAKKLLRDGVIVKAWRETGYESFIRVSIGLHEENNTFLNAIGRAISETPELECAFQHRA